MRHIQTRYMWLQERLKEKHLTIDAIKGTKNFSDVLTKAVSGPLLRKHLETMGCNFGEASTLHKRVLG